MSRNVIAISAALLCGLLALAGEGVAARQNGQVNALLAEADRAPLAARRDPARLAALAAAARTRLRAGALDPGALYWLAMAAPGPERHAWLALGAAVSRRDARIGLALLAEAAATGDAPAALAHLDRVWTTHPELGDRLAPLLVAALEDRRVLPPFVARIRQGRPWVRALVDIAVRGQLDLAPLARGLIAAGPLSPGGDYGSATPLLLGLLEQGYPAAALTLVAKGIANGPALLAEPGFTPATVEGSARPFAWSLSEDGDVVARLEDGNILRLAAQPGGATEFASRLMALPQRPLRLQLAFAAGADPRPDAVSLRLDCLVDGASTRSARWRFVPSPTAPVASADWQNAGCALTVLSLSVETLAAPVATGLAITRFRIQPIGPSPRP